MSDTNFGIVSVLTNPFLPGLVKIGVEKNEKLDVSGLLALTEDYCEAYLQKEVIPYRSDAWIDHRKIKVGYEIPFNRHFYEYEASIPLEEIESDIEALVKDIMSMLHEVMS